MGVCGKGEGGRQQKGRRTRGGGGGVFCMRAGGRAHRMGGQLNAERRRPLHDVVVQLRKQLDEVEPERTRHGRSRTAHMQADPRKRTHGSEPTHHTHTETRTPAHTHDCVWPRRHASRRMHAHMSAAEKLPAQAGATNRGSSRLKWLVGKTCIPGAGRVRALSARATRAVRCVHDRLRARAGCSARAVSESFLVREGFLVRVILLARKLFSCTWASRRVLLAFGA
eukprot:2943503-Pleurochrysis_carterae.AAC.2